MKKRLELKTKKTTKKEKKGKEREKSCFEFKTKKGRNVSSSTQKKLS